MVPLLIITITITLNNVIKCSHQIKLTPPLYLPLDLAKTSKIYRVWARRVIRLSFFMSSCFGAKTCEYILLQIPSCENFQRSIIANDQCIYLCYYFVA